MDYDELAELMSEPAGGWNDGRVAIPLVPKRDGTIPRRRTWSLDARMVAKLEGVGGRPGDRAHVVDAYHDSKDARGGLVTHRGVLHPDEYVDPDALRRAVEERLGFTVEDVRRCYGGRAGGPLPRALRATRDAIDRALAGIDDVATLARALGVPELERALRRGRERGGSS